VRYAVVGLGHIAQVAVIPAFAHARKNSELVAIVSGDPTKRRELARRYRIDHAFTYEEFDQCLGMVDAVYIALPNSMHAEYTIRSARAGVHVLCEKPMAVTVEECHRMTAACRRAKVKLMIAYRLHFEEINLAAIDLARSGRLGKLKFFNSSFSMTVKRGDIRTKRAYGGGSLYDIGVYCINAARYLFRAEPTQVSAVSINRGDAPFWKRSSRRLHYQLQRRRCRRVSNRGHQGRSACRAGLRIRRGTRVHADHRWQDDPQARR
jgi:predicted dehydrogenase